MTMFFEVQASTESECVRQERQKKKKRKCRGKYKRRIRKIKKNQSNLHVFRHSCDGCSREVQGMWVLCSLLSFSSGGSAERFTPAAFCICMFVAFSRAHFV